jgi:excisionase family DNA binding protein
MEPQYLTREEAADFLRVSLPTLDRWAEDGKIRKHTIRGIRSVRYIRSELSEVVVPTDQDGAA